jgi:hypothetical protein
MSTQAVMTAARPISRVIVDQHETMGYPLCPMGRTLDAQITETDTKRRVEFERLGWRIEQPKNDEHNIPTTILYDVYYGLLWLFKEAGFPDDGEVYFSRYNFLQAIGWVSNGRNGSGGKLTKPSGRHYRQLRDVMHSLMFTAYVKDTPGRQQGFNVLSYYDLVEDQPGPRGMGEELPRRSKVILNKVFVQGLKSGAPLAEIDFDQYLGLSTGAPRVLHRFLSWMRHDKRESVSLGVLFDRIGSKQQNQVPAVARKILATAHKELIAHGVLAGEPEYERINGEWFITYPFTDPSKARAEDAILTREAISCGVAEAMAKELVVAHRVRFEEVLAAVAAGRVRDRDKLAGTIVSYTRRPDWAIPPECDGAQPKLLRCMADQYRDYLIAEQDRMVLEREVNLAALRNEIVRERTARGLPLPENDWFLDGMIRLLLATMFDQISLAEFEMRQKAGV